MKSGKRLLHLSVASLIFLGGVALIVYLADPFFHYHEPWFDLKAVEDQKEYQVPGMLKNFSYDSVLAGSSVVMSVNTDTLDARFDCETVKAVGGSASAPLLREYLEMAFEGRALRYVFYGLDVFSFYHNPDMQVIDDDVVYLINGNPFDDAAYLWNMDVIGEKVPAMLKKSRDESYSEGLLYQLNAGAVLGLDAVLKMHRPGAGAVQEMKPLDYYEAYVSENLDRLEKMVAEHAGTQFYFFVPPYHIVWWDDAYEKGLLDAYLHTLERCMKNLLPYENVRFYKTDFNEASVITDAYQYMDYIHGGTMVTERMARQIGAPQEEITLETCEAEIDRLREIFETFRAQVESDVAFGLNSEGSRDNMDE